MVFKGMVVKWMGQTRGIMGDWTEAKDSEAVLEVVEGRDTKMVNTQFSGLILPGFEMMVVIVPTIRFSP